MKKKIISIAVLSAIILTTLVGCGNKKGEVSETTEPTTEISTEAITDAPTTAPTETPVTELKKGNITVTGDFGQATKVDVNGLTDSDEYKSIEENLGDLITSFSCYDINISTADGKAVQPEGTVNVIVKLSDELKVANGNSYAVFYTDGNKIAKVESSVNGDELTFKTTHFSVYAVVKYDSEDKVANATFSNIPNDGVGEMVEINTIKHEHSYNDAVTKNATCTENGVKTFSCECGDSYTEEIAATGHRFGSYVYNNDATCTNDGTETSTCSICNKTDTRIKAGTIVGHSIVESITKQPTCGSTGTKTFTCSNCGHSHSEDISATGNHSWGEYIYNNDATCSREGTKTATCSVCGAKDTVLASGTQLWHTVVDGRCIVCGMTGPEE